MEKKDKIDLFLKSLALVGAIFSFLFGIHRYEKVNQDESAKAFWNQQFPIYKQLCNTASTISTNTDSTIVNKAKNDFWEMYYGEARMVIDMKVHEKMSMFASTLIKVENKTADRNELVFAAFNLSTECRKSLSISWKIPLSELTKD